MGRHGGGGEEHRDRAWRGGGGLYHQETFQECLRGENCGGKQGGTTPAGTGAGVAYCAGGRFHRCGSRDHVRGIQARGTGWSLPGDERPAIDIKIRLDYPSNTRTPAGLSYPQLALLFRAKPFIIRRANYQRGGCGLIVSNSAEVSIPLRKFPRMYSDVTALSSSPCFHSTKEVSKVVQETERKVVTVRFPFH